MLTRTRNLVGALVVGAALVLTPMAAGSASGQTTIQDGLVNVSIGDITILRNVNVAIAANVVAQVCGVTVQNVNVLAADVDQTGTSRTVCDAGNQFIRLPVTISQN